MKRRRKRQISTPQALQHHHRQECVTEGGPSVRGWHNMWILIYFLSAWVVHSCESRVLYSFFCLAWECVRGWYQAVYGFFFSLRYHINHRNLIMFVTSWFATAMLTFTLECSFESKSSHSQISSFIHLLSIHLFIQVYCRTCVGGRLIWDTPAHKVQCFKCEPYGHLGQGLTGPFNGHYFRCYSLISYEINTSITYK